MPVAAAVVDDSQRQSIAASPNTRAYTSRLPAPQEEDEDDGDFSDASSYASSVTPGERRDGCCGGCCGEHDRRGIDEYIFDWTMRPIFNAALGYFSQPTSLHLFIYYGGGCFVYRYLEDWSFSEAAYFLTVTATTVGYGDLCPVTTLGRAFTIFSTFYGISVVLGALTPLIAILHGDWRENVLLMLGSKEGVDTSNKKLSIVEINKRIDYSRRYFLALLSPIAVLLVGVAFYYFAIREPLVDASATLYGVDLVGLVDAFYFACITMTTVGYGDLTPQTEMARAFAILYLPFAVVALADAVTDVSMISLRRSIRETDFGKFSDESLIRDAVRQVVDASAADDPEAEPPQPNFAPVLTEAEFVVDQLLANGLVDSEAIIAIKRQFQHLTRHGRFAGDEPMLTTRLVYEEIRERAQSVGEALLSPGAEALDVAPDPKTGVPSFRWKSYEEWMVSSWQFRVRARVGEASGPVRATPPGLKSLNVMSFRMM